MTDPVPITKMAGAGNDFIVLDGPAADRIPGPFPDWIRAVCRRSLSVGADGVLTVRPVPGGRVQVVFHNPDGSEAFCGNGTRCAARYAFLAGLSGDRVMLDTCIGQVPAETRRDGMVRLTLPPVRDLGERTLAVDGETVRGRFVHAGVPHFVVQVEDVAVAPLERWGPAIRSHPEFGEDGTNLDLIALTAGGQVRIRTWERGVEGETLSCGTGAVAAGALVSGSRSGGEVLLRPWSGAALSVTLQGSPADPRAVVLAGDARVVFRGELDPEALEPSGADRTV